MSENLSITKPCGNKITVQVFVSGRFVFLGIASIIGVALAGLSLSVTANTNDFDAIETIPHSVTSQASGKGVVAAKLACATDRYAHGVLGDSIEAGCLVVLDENKRTHKLSLPDSQVFEDLIPRIADVNNDGRNDVVVVRSHQDTGAALAIYTITDNQLLELAATPPIGLSNRWLAPIGVHDFNNDGKQDVAYVQTPHIGGILKVWTFSDNGFVQIAEQRGFSNHGIGSTRVSTDKVADYNDDGVVDIALPDQSWQSTVWVSLHPEFKILAAEPYRSGDFK